MGLLVSLSWVSSTGSSSWTNLNRVLLQVTTHHHKHLLLPLLMEELHLLLMRELMLEVEEKNRKTKMKLQLQMQGETRLQVKENKKIIIKIDSSDVEDDLLSS